MTAKPDRTEKLNRKLRASEAARVAAVRRCDVLEKNAATSVFTISDLKKDLADVTHELDAALSEVGRLESEADSLREKVPHVGARIAMNEMEAEIAKLRTTIAMRDGAILGLNAVIDTAIDECEAQKTVENVKGMDAVIAVLRGGE